MEDRVPPSPEISPLASVSRPLLTVEDLGTLLGPRGARRVLERGELPGFRVGRRWFLRLQDLDVAIAEKVSRQRVNRESAARLLHGLRARRAARRA